MNIGGYKMTTALFTNQVLTQATPATVRALLADPLNLPAWATAITTVKPTATGYVLQRSGSVFDQPEQLQVTVGTDDYTAELATIATSEARHATRLSAEVGSIDNISGGTAE